MRRFSISPGPHAGRTHLLETLKGEFVRRCGRARARVGPSVVPAVHRIPNLVLLFLARGLLRSARPLQAHAVMMRLGAFLPALRTPEDARRAARSLGRHGSCLSRALAVAARAPTADVVIGVEPRGAAPLFAHAWVEMGGAPIDPMEVAGVIIARLRGPRSTTQEVREGGSPS